VNEGKNFVTTFINMAPPEIVWVLGRTSVVPKGVSSPNLLRSGGGGGVFSQSPLLCKEGPGEVEIWPAYTNHGSPERPSLWMLLPLLTSPYKGEGKCGSPYKGEESEGRPHKSLKSHKHIVCNRFSPP